MDITKAAKAGGIALMRSEKDSNERGRRFEALVEAVLRTLEEEHPDKVSVEPQPADVTLRFGQNKIPDFRLIITEPDIEYWYLIECQDRQRYDTEIADKIDRIQTHGVQYGPGGSTPRVTKNFMFVYNEESGDASATVRILEEANGVLCYSLSGFRVYLEAKSKILDRLKDMDDSSSQRVCSSHSAGVRPLSWEEIRRRAAGLLGQDEWIEFLRLINEKRDKEIRQFLKSRGL